MPRDKRSAAGSHSRSRDLRDDGGKFDGKPAPPGFGSLSSRPRVHDNPRSFAGRRAASREYQQLSRDQHED